MDEFKARSKAKSDDEYPQRKHGKIANSQARHALLRDIREEYANMHKQDWFKKDYEGKSLGHSIEVEE